MAGLSAYFESLIEAQRQLALWDRAQKDAALSAVAQSLDGARKKILAANKVDVEKARKDGIKESLIDRLSLNDSRIDDIISGLMTVRDLDDPIGRLRAGWTLPNGLEIQQITVPLGVVAIIYESRPNVTVDAFALAFKAGCSILLRGSSAALNSNRALVVAVKEALRPFGLDNALALADSGERDEVDEILSAVGKIDVVIPRGGKNLIQHVVQNARIPVIETGEGNCHIYVEKTASLDSALAIIENAKIQRPGVCNAVETLLIERGFEAELLPPLVRRLGDKVEFRLCPRSKLALNEFSAEGKKTYRLIDATEKDWEEEYLDLILAVRVVANVDEAIAHINHYGTQHSEAILSNDHAHITRFEQQVDAAAVYSNTSTRFTDGAQFGFGAELGISTQKFHARGPMGLDALTTIKYRIRGQGQIRP